MGHRYWTPSDCVGVSQCPCYHCMVLAGFAVNYLGSGSGEQAKRAWCRENAGQRPWNGEILRQTATGEHTMKVRNAPGNDTVVKLKNSSNTTVLSLFVRSGETAVVENVPEGSFKVMFASGGGYSRACGYFLDDLSVSKNPKTVDFRTTQRGNYISTAIYELTLSRVVDGNLTPQKTSLAEFVDE